MNKILNYILLFLLLFMFGCAYKPILNQKNYQFSINIDEAKGNRQINSIIINKLNSLNENNKTYDLTLLSNKKTNIISKDSKGDPSIYELLINVNYNVKIDGNVVLKKIINKKTTYNNILDKFEMQNYENNIVNNLSLAISEKIISTISEIN